MRNNELNNSYDAISDSFRSPNLTVAQIEHLARTQRAQMLGELIADAAVWLMNLPNRMKASSLHPAAR